MRVLVCGGRTYSDWARVCRTLDFLSTKPTCIIHGAAKGADSLAAQWALIRNVPVKGYPANWKLHGNYAGPIRNQLMLDHGRPDLVVAFPGNEGTADMVRRARSEHIRVIEVK